MSRAAPFRTASQVSVRGGSWRLDGPEGERPLPDALPGWDYAADLGLRRTVTVEMDAVREETGVSLESSLGITATWWPDASKLRRAAPPIPIRGSGSVDIELHLELSGTELGGRLILQTALVLLDEDHTPRPWIAHRAASALWSDSVSVRLQGEGAMFPMAIVNLADHGHPANAPWVLEPPVELNAAAMGSMYLLVNRSNTAVREAVLRADDPRPVDQAILSSIYYDVGRTLVELALDHDEVASEQFDDESFGDVLQGLLSSLFPGEEFMQLRKRRDGDITRFSAELGDRLRLMAEVSGERT